MKAFASDRVQIPLPAAHPFPMAKFRLLRERLTDVREARRSWGDWRGVGARPSGDRRFALFGERA